MIGDNGWTWPAAWLSTARQWGLLCPPYNAEFQGDRTMAEVEAARIPSLGSGKTVWNSFLPHVLVALIVCWVRNRIETFLRSNISLWTKLFSFEVYVCRKGQNPSDLQSKPPGVVYSFDSWSPTQVHSPGSIQIEGCVSRPETNLLAGLYTSSRTFTHSLIHRLSLWPCPFWLWKGHLTVEEGR